MAEKRFLLEPNEFGDDQCVEAWRKLRAEFWTTDLLRAIYGGIVLGHIEFGYEFWSPKKHGAEFAVLGGNREAVRVDSSGTLSQRVRIPFSDIRNLLALHSFDEGESLSHGYGPEQVNALHLLIQVALVDPDETGLDWDGKALPG